MGTFICSRAKKNFVVVKSVSPFSNLDSCERDIPLCSMSLRVIFLDSLNNLYISPNFVNILYLHEQIWDSSKIKPLHVIKYT